MNRTVNSMSLPLTLFMALLCGCVNGQDLTQKQSVLLEQPAPDARTQIVWALNLGGPAHLSAEEVNFQADTLSMAAIRGQINHIRGVLDGTVFQSYRTGDLNLQQAVPNGAYDITFLFAEPEDIPVGSRVFSITAENKPVITNLDIRRARDGNHHAALVRTVVGVEVSDGQLDISFDAIKGQPVLNGLLVHRKNTNPDAWSMVWNDEFDYEGAPDPGKWTHDIWPAGKVNGEDQAYTDRLKNVRVEGGNLVIEAFKENYNHAAYTSGRIHSLGKGDFLYGRADIRAKLPAGQGTWPAIWMLPSDPYKYSTTCAENEDWQGSHTCDAWPNSGEIDIMEHVGYDMNRVHGTVHTKAYYWVNGKQRKATVEGKDVAEAFHVYSVEWSPDRIDILFDDSLYFSYLKESDDWQEWPFDQPFHMILNLVVGGDWGRAGGPIDNSIFPTRMEVDYVRVFKQAAAE